MSKKYYITETENVGPNADADDHYYEITTDAPRGNSDNEIKTEGWLGTYNDWSDYARGEYETLDAARYEITCVLLSDGYREESPRAYYDDPDSGVVARFRVGQLQPCGAGETCDFVYDEFRGEIEAGTSDAQIDELVSTSVREYASEAGGALDAEEARELAHRLRSELRDEMAAS